jgi:hypothetical protein
MSFSRRGFLRSASASLGVALLDGSLLNAEDLENTFKEIRANLLEMINEEREVAKVPPPYMYADRQSGVVDVSLDGKLTTKIRLFKSEPGIYTIVTWISRYSGKPFPATAVCIEAL